MSKFTPGPWRYLARFNNDSQTENVLGGIQEEDGDQLNIARIWADGPNPEADANLIAAAPELYEALKVTCLWLQSTLKTWHWDGDQRDAAEAELQDAYKALAKADGSK